MEFRLQGLRFTVGFRAFRLYVSGFRGLGFYSN